MLLLNLVFLALLGISNVQSDIPRFVHGRWILNDEDVNRLDDREPLPVEVMWPESPAVLERIMVEEQSFLTTLKPSVMKEQASDVKGEESAVWKMVLVAAVLLVSVVGSLSVAYYLYVWRGGRIHYHPQKENYS
ncbi:Hypothetical protein SMAX5B_003641 [Scomber scombrus]|uniref:Uncharacterized protein n=1 Tax=Scomber scombrus TaxID=13677 RepID=A0AAV1NMN5_SCOSC